MPHKEPDSQLKLPLMAIGRVDVSRLLRESEAVDQFMTQSAIRQPGTSVKMPKTSRLLDEMVESNKLNLLVAEDRHRIISFLKATHTKAPVLHFSFGADPSPLFTQKLITWLRINIHPAVLVQMGLQPGLGVGCVLRSTNKYFDLSLRQKFADNRQLLIDKLGEAKA